MLEKLVLTYINYLYQEQSKKEDKLGYQVDIGQATVTEFQKAQDVLHGMGIIHFQLSELFKILED